jgi:hypothetical protein
MSSDRGDALRIAGAKLAFHFIGVDAALSGRCLRRFDVAWEILETLSLWPSSLFSIFAKLKCGVPEAFAFPEQDAVAAGNAQFETFRYAPRPLLEIRRGRRRADLSGGFLEQSQPAIKVHGVNGKRQMFDHRIPMVASGHQHDR